MERFSIQLRDATTRQPIVVGSTARLQSQRDLVRYKVGRWYVADYYGSPNGAWIIACPIDPTTKKIFLSKARKFRPSQFGLEPIR